MTLNSNYINKGSVHTHNKGSTFGITDVLAFFNHVENARTHNLDVTDAYSMMMFHSEDGLGDNLDNYVMMFSKNEEIQINNNLPEAKVKRDKLLKKYWKKNSSELAGFLHLVKDEILEVSDLQEAGFHLFRIHMGNPNGNNDFIQYIDEVLLDETKKSGYKYKNVKSIITEN